MISSLYIHIPFCLSKCRYCAFTSFSGQQSYYGRYIAAVKNELASISSIVEPLQTIFFGGGTPTVLGARALVELLDFCKELWGIAPDAEISTEANPETIDQEGFFTLLSGGFNRLSLGVQSFLDEDLQFLGRPHGGKRALEAFAEARRAGFTNINLDLMYGLHGQSAKAWQKNLQLALALEPEHLSLYQLTPEEGTPYALDVKEKRALLPDDDLALAMDRITEELCNKSGLFPYETSNYAQSGYQCRHNCNYWRNNEYIACGAGAVSFVAGVREQRVEQLEDYCQRVESGESPINSREELCGEDSFRETVVIGLRMREGVSFLELEDRYGIKITEYYGKILEKMVEEELLVWQGDRLLLTKKGRPLANMVLSELV